MTTTITTMMSNRATITPTTGPIAPLLLLLLLPAVDCCGELTMIIVQFITYDKIKLAYHSSS